jgi:hypothetical protein
VAEPLRELLGGSPWLKRTAIRYGRSFEPDVVYSLLGTLGVTRVSALVAADRGCPIVPHFTDHWVDTKFVGSPFAGHLRRRLHFWLDEVLARSPVVLTVSGSMGREYGNRFGREAIPLATLVEPAAYLRPETPANQGSSGCRLVYAGNLGLDRWRTLKLVASVLGKIAAEGTEVRLEVYCSEADRLQYQDALAAPGLVLMDWVPASRLPGLLAGADVLLHVESPDPRYLEYVRYSFSTKLSHYMMAGRCLLLVGPPDAGSMTEVREMGAGIVVSTAPGELEPTLRRVITDASLREEMGRRARSLALDHFEASSQRERFREVLAAAASGAGPVPTSDARDTRSRR